MSIVSIQITTDQLRQLDALCVARGESRSAVALGALLSVLGKGTEPAPEPEVVEIHEQPEDVEVPAYMRARRAPKKEA